MTFKQGTCVEETRARESHAFNRAREEREEGWTRRGARRILHLGLVGVQWYQSDEDNERWNVGRCVGCCLQLGSCLCSLYRSCSFSSSFWLWILVVSDRRRIFMRVCAHVYTNKHAQQEGALCYKYQNDKASMKICNLLFHYALGPPI